MNVMFENLEVSIDVPATRAFHAAQPLISCVCGNCMLYQRAIEHARPETLSFFDALGIDPLHILGVESYQGGPEPLSFLKSFGLDPLNVLDEEAYKNAQQNGVYLYECHTLLVSCDDTDVLPDKLLKKTAYGLTLFLQKEPSEEMKLLTSTPQNSLNFFYQFVFPATEE